MTKVLRVFASMRHEGSATRDLAEAVTAKLRKEHGSVDVIDRDLAVDAPGFVDQEWIGANFTPKEDRTEAQKARLTGSDALIEELKAADVVVIASPIYNFGVPAALKAWVDMVARARVTFKYTENGPVGLLEGKKAIIATASGGTKTDSDIDFATPYLRHVMGFIGIHDVSVYAADQMMMNEGALESAKAKVAA